MCEGNLSNKRGHVLRNPENCIDAYMMSINHADSKTEFVSLGLPNTKTCISLVGQQLCHSVCFLHLAQVWQKLDSLLKEEPVNFAKLQRNAAGRRQIYATTFQPVLNLSYFMSCQKTLNDKHLLQCFYTGDNLKWYRILYCTFMKILTHLFIQEVCHCIGILIVIVSNTVAIVMAMIES